MEKWKNGKSNLIINPSLNKVNRHSNPAKRTPFPSLAWRTSPVRLGRLGPHILWSTRTSEHLQHSGCSFPLQSGAHQAIFLIELWLSSLPARLAHCP